MLPPPAMLATKNRAGRELQIFFLLAAIFIAGCTPPGSRALLDGKRLLDQGKYPEAVEKLKIATSLLNTNAQAWNYLGLAYHRAGQPTNAAVAYQKALTFNRDLSEARYNLGCLWLEQNKLDSAKAEFTAYTLRRGDVIEGWLKLGTAQLRAREATAAEKSFREALRISQQNVEALNGLGLVQLQRNRPREAAQLFGAALKQQADYRPALLNLATVLEQHLNDRAGALQRYRDYLALKPKPANWEAVNAVAQTLAEQLAAPPPRPRATNAVPPAVATTNATKMATTTVARVTVPAKTESTPAPPKPTVASPPPANTTAVEIVTLAPEPVIKTSPDAPPPNPSPKIEPSPAEPTPTPPPPVALAEQSSNPPERGFFSRINPLNLFRREAKSTPKPTPLPPSKKSPSTGSEGQPNPPLRVEQATASANDGASVSGRSSASPTVVSPETVERPTFPRYVYLSPSMPAAGNRSEAARAFGQGQQAQRANRLAEAIQAYRRATVLDPSYFEAYYNLGLAALEFRSYPQALAAWENALALQPASNDARYNFALTLKAANYAIDAANELEKILAANPNETRAHLVMGTLCADQFHDLDRARTHYQKVLELEPRHAQASAIRYWLMGNPP